MSTLLRKMLASASVVAILSTLMVSTAVAYSDVAEGDVWFDAVEQGTSDGVFASGDTFEPFEAVDRAHMAMYAAKAAGIDAVPYKGGFPDVAADHPQADWIQAVVDNGIQKGYDDGNFGPSDILLRGQAAIILKNAFSIESLDGCAPSFPDLMSDHYAYGAIQDMYCWSVLNGYENGNFGPNDTLVKYQVAIIINNAKYHLEARETTTDTTPVSSGEVTITEGENMPVASTVPQGATNVNFLSFTLTAGDEEADVDGITFTRQGVGATSDFANVYLYEGNNRLTSGRSVSSDENTVEFSSLGWNFAPGESRTFEVRVDLNTSLTSGNEHRFYVYEMEGATAGGEVNLAGPYMTIGGQSAATVSVEKNGTLTNPSLGDNGVKVSQFKVSASGEDVSLKWLNVYLAGTISQTELGNYKLYQGSVVSDDNLVAEQDEVSDQDTINFDLGDGIDIEDGDEQIFVMTADMDGDADDTVITYFDETTDVYAVGDVFATGTQIDIAAMDTTAEGHSLTLQGGEVTISFEGPAATDIPVDTKKVGVLDFSIKADRDIEVKQLQVTITDTAENGGADANDLLNSVSGEANYKNIRIMEGDKNLMETEDLSTSGSDVAQTLTFTDSFYMDAGETKDLTVKFDVDDDALGGETVRATLVAVDPDSGIKDISTNKFVSDIVPTTAITGNIMTLVASSLDVRLASTPVSDTFVKGTKNIPVVGFLFQSGTADSVHVTGITLKGYMDEDGALSSFAGTAGSDNSVNLKDIVNSVRMYEDGYAADKDPIAGPKGVEDNGTVVFDNLSYDIPASTTKKLVVVGDVSTNAYVNSNSETFSFDIDDASADITAEDSDGDTIAVGGSGTDSDDVNGAASPSVFMTTESTGTLTIATKTSQTPSSNIVIAGRTGVELARFEFSATIEDITVNDLDLGFQGSGGADEVVSISVYDADDLTTPLDSGFVQSGIVDLDDLGFVVPADDSAVMVVTADLNTLPAGADSGDAFSVSLKTLQEAQGAAGTDVTVVEETAIAGTCDLAADINDSVTAVGVAAACTGVAAGDIVIIGSEYMLVLDVDADDNGTATDWTVARGVAGTDAAAHTDADSADDFANEVTTKGNYMVLRETKPTFETVAYPSNTKLTNGSGIGVYKFTVDAEAEEDVDLGTIVFKVSGQAGGVSFGAGTSNLRSGLATDASDGIVKTNEAPTTAGLTNAVLHDLTDGEDVENVTFWYQNGTSANYIIAELGDSEEISAAGKTYELRVDIAGIANNGDYVSVHIPKTTDSTKRLVTTAINTARISETSGLTDADDNTISDDIVWSDESNTSHSTSTSDWTNGYLLKSLKTVAQTLTFTTS